VGLALAEAEGLAPGEALGLAEAEALEAELATVLSSTARACIPLSSKPRSSLAEAEALLIALVEAEALEAGLALRCRRSRDLLLRGRPSPDHRSPYHRPFGHASPYHRSPRRLRGRPRRVRTPARPTPPTRQVLTIYASFLLLFACTSTERMHHPGSYDLYKFMDLFTAMLTVSRTATPRAVIPDGPRLIGEPISSVSSCVCTEERPEHISSRRTQTVTKEVR